MISSDLERVVEQDHAALNAFVQGDPEPKKRLYSRADDVTLANPLGPPARGWAQVCEAIERAASVFSGGEPLRFERISGYATPDLGYTVEIERGRTRIAGSPDMKPVALRATTIWRREDGEWRTVHRHADPITSVRSPETIVQPAEVEEART